MSVPHSLLTREFLALNAIVFLAYCNVAVFFEFHHYLGSLPIDPHWFGFLIGIFSVTVLVVRPVISPFLHPDNAKPWIGASCAGVTLSLVLYHVAQGFGSMTVVRVIHGTMYVVFATAVLSKIVGCIPKDKSGQAFGLIGVITLLPYAVVPPVLDPLTQWAGGFDHVLDLSAGLMLLSFPLLFFVDGKQAEASEGRPGWMGWAAMLANLKDIRVAVLLVLSLLVWTSFTPVFYFLKGYGDQLGIANPGWFFTLSTLTEIGVRLVAGPLFDKLDKARMIAVPLVVLIAGYVVLAHASGPVVFYGMGLFLGLGWGMAMPLLSGLIFDLSDPACRAMNTNLSMMMFQAGFFFGPLLGGPILIHWGYAALYYACAAVLLAGLLMTPALSRKGDRHQNSLV